MTTETAVEELETQESAPALTASIEKINRVMKALYIHKKAASYKELAGPSDLHPSVASQALSSSRDLGLTKGSGKKGWYLLSSQGIEYARYLTENRTDQCQGLLKRIILSNPMWIDIVSFLRTSEGTARNPIDLVMSTVETRLGKQWSPDMRRTVSDSIVSVLEYSGIIKKESGKIISLIGSTDVMGVESIVSPRHGAPSTSTPVETRNVIQTTPGFYEIAGDGFYIRIRRDPMAIAEAFDHVQLIMKRSIQNSKVNPIEFEKAKDSTATE